MAYTNTTANLELPQYVGTDRPAYLTDFNGAMETIDTAVHNNSVNIASTNTNIGAVNNKIGDLEDLDTTAKTSTVVAINEVNTKTATNATKIQQNTELINEVMQKFNLYNITKYTSPTGLTITNGSISSINMTVATNSDKSICKIYGELVTTGNTTGASVEVTLPTDFDVEENFAVFPSGLRLGAYGESSASVNVINYINFKTNGNVVLGFTSKGSGNYAIWIPFLIFVKNFGDAPTE